MSAEMIRDAPNQSAAASFADKDRFPTNSTEHAGNPTLASGRASGVEQLLDLAEKLRRELDAQEWCLQVYGPLSTFLIGIGLVSLMRTVLDIMTLGQSPLAASKFWDVFLFLVLGLTGVVVGSGALRHWKAVQGRVLRDRRALNEVLIILQEIGAEVRAEYSALEYASFRIRASRLDIGSERAPSNH